ncbi:hypothetical protein LB507_005615 [Fusarium sp. FIESC RH6]|nr:hypothetical protein LB507_005615 [Fusarium sp. FIESC RH6]
MRTPQELPDGNISFPAIDLLPLTILVEETQHDPTSDLTISVESMDKAHAQRLYSQNRSSWIIDMQNNSASTKVTGESDSAPRLKLGENRKGVLGAFDFRNDKIPNPKTPALYRTLDEVNEAIAMLKDPDLIRTNSELEREKKKQAKSSPPVVGVQKIYDLVHNDPHGGLSYFDYTASDDPSTRAPRGGVAYLFWMGHKSPVMVRALELVWQYVRDQGQRVLIYVDTPWIPR